MHHIKRYLDRNNLMVSEFGEFSLQVPDIIVIIPSYKENNIFATLDALQLCDHANLNIEVLIYVNGKDEDDDETQSINEKCYADIIEYRETIKSSHFKIYCHKKLDNAAKKHGVGMARKFLMDEAVMRFYHYKKNKGIIINLDADSTVEQNYFKEIYQFFKRFPDTGAISIYFEHKIREHPNAIIEYELHLRYFIGMQKLLNLPFAFQTIGSAMAVTVDGYVKVGGMNTRQAGEDFYFLHKFSKIGILKELNSTTVFPSDRISDRVPFGTGKAISQFIETGSLLTYNFEAFEKYGLMMDLLDDLYKDEAQFFKRLDQNVTAFLVSIGFRNKIMEIKNNVSSCESFKKRFYQNFGAFFLMKYLHAMRNAGFPDTPLNIALPKYFKLLNLPYSENQLENLKKLRVHDKVSAKLV